MHFQPFFTMFSRLLILALVGTSAAADIRVRATASKTAFTSPNAPTQTGTISSCNEWYDVVTGDSCSSVASAFGITLAQFLAWNPAVSSDCSTNFWVGDAYCVGINSAAPSSSTKSTSKSTTISTGVTSSGSKTAFTTPSAPTQTGTIPSCDLWYVVTSTDTCATVTAAFNITLAQFLAWNPAVSQDCATNFWAGDAYCVGINPHYTSTSSSMPVSSASPTTTTPPGTYSIFSGNTTFSYTSTNATWPPTATQTGIASNCQRWYEVQPGDSCQDIVNQYASFVTMDTLLQWNPALGSDCSQLWANYWLCIYAPPTTSIINTTAAATQIFPGWTPVLLPTLNASSAAPSPTQSGLVASCQGFYQAGPGDNCQNITSSLGYLTVQDFELWNPAVTDCNNLTVGYYYCIANGTCLPYPPVLQSQNLPPASAASTQTASIISSCGWWFQADEGDDCLVIPQYFGNVFSEAQFISWNLPAVGSDCSGITAGGYYCVGTTPGGVAPTGCQTSTTVTGTTLNTGVTSTLQTTGVPTSVSGASFPTTLTGSSSTSATTASATSAPSTTSTSSSSTAAVAISTPSPVQTGMAANCGRFYLVQTGNDCFDIAQDAGIALSDFYAWNPAVSVGNNTCGGLQAGVYVCVGLGGPIYTTITSGSPVPATPTPFQTGMATNCRRFYDVHAGDGCLNLASEAGVALTDFYAWNPAVKTDCSGLQASVFVCIGTQGPVTTIITGTPVAAAATTG
ncbi:hypothetical protein QBC46DRAFT_42828 [Diplogelasinospora grovesii]|uniref:LysM domain-containing protein n=1 Tax=Diplogelasinospora grovesii TaxID=303347 RepID=A0AAN6S0B6_9PEZI|nr:hypothetical protein QBC46DRAFT_42828 [Diplogelasinospora grovesii]